MSTTSEKPKPFYLQPKFIFGIVATANLLNYIDRGIIPGSTNEINSFIKSDLDTDTPDVFLGLLQSSFIIGFMIGSIVFSHLIYTYGRFTLTGIGCLIWIFAVTLSGSAYYANSYVFLLFARILSGIAEASMQCAIPPWIQKTAPAHQKGLWLGIFYMAIPVGTALGYAYSSICSESIGWQFAFFIEGIVMAPFVAYMFLISPHFPPDKIKRDDGSDEQVQPTVWEETLIVCGRPVFLCFCMAYAAQSATLTGLSTFGSALMMGLGYFDTESDASTVFGVVISVSGMIATPLGGFVLDRLLADHRTRFVEAGDERRSSIIEEILEEIDEQQLAPLVAYETEHPTREQIYSNSVNQQLETICLYVVAFSAVGGLLLALVFVVYNKGLFLFLIAVGSALIFMTNSAIMMGVMISVPVSTQSFGIAVNNICLHGLGDVPSPVLVGYIKDVLAPGCVANADDDGNIAASDSCRNDGEGLRITMLVTTLWLFWVVFFYLLAWIFCKRKYHLFSWGVVDFNPSQSSSEYVNNDDDSSQSANLLREKNRQSGVRERALNNGGGIVKEGANQSVIWQSKSVSAPDDATEKLQTQSEHLEGDTNLFEVGKKSKVDQVKTSLLQHRTSYDDSYLHLEREQLLSSHRKLEYEKENDFSVTRRTNSADGSSSTSSPHLNSANSKNTQKSRVLSNDELQYVSKSEKQRNVERIKRLSKDKQQQDSSPIRNGPFPDERQLSRNSLSSVGSASLSRSVGSAKESNFQKISKKKGLLQKEGFAHRLREMEDTIAI